MSSTVANDERILTPTIHLNGTGAETLRREYDLVATRLLALREAFWAATCNPRDYYPQGDGAWEKANRQREEATAYLLNFEHYIDSIREGLWNA